MKKHLSSIDLNFLLKDFKELEGSRIDKIYQPEKELLILSLHKPNIGKMLLRIKLGQSINIVEQKEDFGETLGFGMFLRKHLDGYFLEEISQLKPERILKFAFKAKDEKKFLYVEFFGKGNLILCSENDVILNALEHHDFRERSVRPKLKYAYPVMGCNLFDLEENKLGELFGNSKKDSVITSLATELGLGGLYSEEACLLSGIDKSTNPKNIDEKHIHSIADSIKRIINHEIEAKVILENDIVIDFVPFDFIFYADKRYDKKDFGSFNEATDHFFSQFKEAKETEYGKKLKSLSHIIEQQRLAVDDLRREEKELREKAEMIYHNYQLIKEILEEINKASKKFSWKEIKERLKNHKTVKEVNDRDRKVVVDID